MSFCTKCGRRRSGTLRYCTGCGAQFPAAVSSAAPVAEQDASIPPPPARDDQSDPMAPFRPPDGRSAPAQTSSEDTDRIAGAGVEHDPFGDLFKPPVEPGAGSPGRSGTAAYGSGAAEPPQAGPPPSGSSRVIIAAVAVAAVLAAGSGAVFWATHRHPAKLSAAQTHATASTSVSPGTSAGSSQPAQSPAPSPTPTPTPGVTATATPGVTGGLVAVAPGVAQDPDASRVESFLNSYFTAINMHSFRNYRKLLNAKMQQQESAQSFRSGYGSTTDSAATLAAISHLGSGSVSAAVTFTSHQLPAASPSGTACTNWSIVLYLHQQSGSYVLGPAPSSYHAEYQSC
jgi:hypothetical protein